ncbi:MAG TPA: glycosyltransferase family 39 protein [Gaiellaceae bacterium]|nr:glycosyltransferase family 39 protein [Gaiellaceae bacterium]
MELAPPAAAGITPRRRIRALAVSPALALGGLVAVSAVVRMLVAWGHATPVFFPDEYIYTELGRSIAAGGRLLIRGQSVGFPAILGPLLTAPAWLVHDVATSYRIVKGIEALSMSLTAVPVYALSRRVGLTARAALAIAALALAVPDFSLVGLVSSEPFAYPFGLAAVAAGVAALTRPSWRSQLAFAAFAVLATLARIQFVVLPVAFVLAALAVGLRERRLRRTIVELRLLLGLFALGALGLAVVGFGYYQKVLHSSVHAMPVLDTAATNLLLLVYSAGWLIVPGAVIGLVLAVARPRSRAELSFGALALAFALATNLEAGAYLGQTHERYVFYLVPLAAIAFALYVGRGWPHRVAHGLLALALATAATKVSLTALLLRGQGNSPVLLAFHWLKIETGGSDGVTSLVVLTVPLVAVAILVALTRVRRVATWFALGGAIAIALAGYAGAAAFDRDNSVAVRDSYLPARFDWIDAHHLGPATLLQSAGGHRTAAMIHMFWNRSVDRVALLPGAVPIDDFANPRVQIGADGTMRVSGRPLDGPLVIDNYGAHVELRGARKVAHAPSYDLWAPAGTPRLALDYGGRFDDGWLAPGASLELWPATGGRLAGRVTIPIALPEQMRATRVRVLLPGGGKVEARLQPGGRRVLTVPVCSSGPWKAAISFSAWTFLGDRPVGARGGIPRYTADPGACARGSLS